MLLCFCVDILRMVQLEFKVGPINVNLRVLLEPKGVLRIIVFVSYKRKRYLYFAMKSLGRNSYLMLLFMYIFVMLGGSNALHIW